MAVFICWRRTIGTRTLLAAPVGQGFGGRLVRSRFRADVAPRGNVRAGTPAHPGPAFGGVGVCVSRARLDAVGAGGQGAVVALPRRRRAWRKRAGRMPAVPGPAFGGASVSVQALSIAAVSVVPGGGQAVGGRARERAHAFGGGASAVAGRSRPAVAGHCGAPPGPGRAGAPSLPTSRSAETCGRDARAPRKSAPSARSLGEAQPRRRRGPGPRASLPARRRPAQLSASRVRRASWAPSVSPARLRPHECRRAGREDRASTANAAPCADVRAGSPRSRAPPSAG